MNSDDNAAATPTDALEREIEHVSKEADAIRARRPHFSPREEQLLHALWEYRKRLHFLRVLAAVADPRQPVDPESLKQLEQRFQYAITAYGSTTEDNVRAASAMSLRLRRSPSGTTALAFEVGSSPTMLSNILLVLCDIVGTADFFSRHLGDAPELKELTPQLWEDAFRAVMLAADALLASPKYNDAVRGTDAD